MQEAFKFYKNKTKEVDLTNVIDCTSKDDERLIKIQVESEKKFSKIGLNPLDAWEAYRFKDKPGLIFIKNPFTAVGQRFWIRQLLKKYTKFPHPNNLLPSRFNDKVTNDFWESLNTEQDEQQRRLIKKTMRWTTLGYHYDWTNKIYDESKKNEFPEDLSRLVSTFAEVLGFENYKSEAAIINFYPLGSTLSAHTDHSEFFLETPLFSISFGQSAIFLIGGTEKDQETLPILLSSGDVLIMSDESRLCYHSVPRVFNVDHQPWNSNEDVTECGDIPQADIAECLKTSEWTLFENYLKDSRINVNVRQVNK